MAKGVKITLTEKQAKEKAMMILDRYNDLQSEEKIISCTRRAELLKDVFALTENRIVEKDIAVTTEVEWTAFENK